MGVSEAAPLGIAVLALLLVGGGAAAQDADDTRWVEATELGLEGQGWPDTAHPYGRLPAKAEGVVRPDVWGLAQDSAGFCARFVTDARTIRARWTLRSESLAMNHMPATGVSGLDLYTRLPGAQAWHWLGVGRPESVTNEAILADGLPTEAREYLLYLPLYNGVASLSVGVPAGASLDPAPPRPPDRSRPICCYGTSIVQGGCASRPGMAYPALLGRWLDRPVINLGFSGNAFAEPEVAALLAELDPCVYVLDPLPNMSPEMVTERIGPFVRTLRAAHAETPIVLVESIEYQNAAVMPGSRSAYQTRNAALRAVYETLQGEGLAGLHYVPGEPLLGGDGEGTVDGTHPTDLGFMRIAEALRPMLGKVLG